MSEITPNQSSAPSELRQSISKKSQINGIKHSVARAQTLVDSMIEMMEQGVGNANPTEADKTHWKRAFGEKDSAIASLQKLVQVMDIIADRLEALYPRKIATNRVKTNLSRAEIDMLADWLKQGEMPQEKPEQKAED